MTSLYIATNFIHRQGLLDRKNQDRSIWPIMFPFFYALYIKYIWPHEDVRQITPEHMFQNIFHFYHNYIYKKNYTEKKNTHGFVMHAWSWSIGLVEFGIAASCSRPAFRVAPHRPSHQIYIVYLSSTFDYAKRWIANPNPPAVSSIWREGSIKAYLKL